MLQPGDSMPHIEVVTMTGDTFAYASIWQRLSLVLVLLDSSDRAAADRYATEFLARRQEFAKHEALCIVTQTPMAAAPAPCVLVADKWGEIVHVAEAEQIAGLPNVDEVLAWTEHVQHRCPECEGEAR